jgi:hypothetical protein
MVQYVNHSASPELAAMDYDNSDGMSIKSASGNIQCDLTQDRGHLRWNVDDGFEGRSPAPRMLEIKVQGVSGKERTKLYSLDIDGVE